LEPSATYVPTTTLEPTTTPFPQPTSGPVVLAPIVHVVARGENLYRIALSYGVSVQALANNNRIVDTSQVYVGQQLFIPIAGASARAAALQPPTQPGPTPVPPTATPNPSQFVEQVVNGLPVSSFVILPQTVRDNILKIYSHGQTLRNNPHAFSSVG